MAKIRPFAVIVLIVMSASLLLGFLSATGINFDISSVAEAQLTSSSNNPTNTFEIDGQIGSLILGMPPDAKTIDMTTVPKFIL